MLDRTRTLGLLCSTVLAACSGASGEPRAASQRDAGAESPEAGDERVDGGAPPDGNATKAESSSADGATVATTCAVPVVTITHTSTTTQPAYVHYVDLTAHPTAVCNDGSPEAYIVRPGSGAAASRWVIDMQGGGSCYDATTCSARASSLTSSAGEHASDGVDISSQMGGILSTSPTANPDFYDATVVQMRYCSSDSWTGANAATQAPFDSTGANLATWSFEGRAIEAAVIDELKAQYGFMDATEILFIGGSAGAEGVYMTVNDVMSLMPPSARFVAAGDAGFDIAITGYDPNGPPPSYTSSAVPSRASTILTASAVWGGRGDRICTANATTSMERASCYSPPNLLAAMGGTIFLPMYVGQTQEDKVQLGNNGLTTTNAVAAKGYASYFTEEMKAAFAATRADVSIFSPDNTVHEQADTGQYFDATYSFPQGTLSDQEALGAWYRNPCSAHQWIQP
jgi:hypothetical protein